MRRSPAAARRWWLLSAGLPVIGALGTVWACGVEPLLPDAPPPQSLAIFPASRTVSTKPGEVVSFAVQASSAAGDPLDGIGVFLAVDPDTPLVLESPPGTGKSSQAQTQVDTVEGLSVRGAVIARLRVDANARPGTYAVFCGLTVSGTAEDAAAPGQPISRLNVVVEDAAALDAGGDADAAD